MKINQLFKTHITDDLLHKVLRCFNYNEINTEKYFCKLDLENYDTINKLNELKDELKKIYLPCKSKIYVDIVTLNDAITILRQILRLFNYKLVSKQKYINNKKLIFYYIIKLLYDKLDNNVKIDTDEKILNFN